MAFDISTARPEESKSFDISTSVEEKSAFGDQLVGGLETMGTILSSIPATIAGGVTGAATTALTLGDAEAGEAVRKGVQESLTYSGGDASKAQLESLGGAIETVEDTVINPAIGGTAGLIDVALHPYSNITQGFEPAREQVEAIKAQGLPKAAGLEALEKTGSPILASMVETFAAAAPDIAAGLGALSKIKKSSLSLSRKPSKVQQRIADEIKSGSTDKEFVKKMVDGAGDIVNDKAAMETVRQGFDDGVIASIKGASKIDKRAMREMVSKLEKGRISERYKIENRPSDVAGDSLLKQISFVKKNNADAGKQLNRISKGLKGKPVNVNDAIETFLRDAEDMGVNIGDDLIADFTGSTIETISPSKKIINDILLKIRRNPEPDAFQAHEFKKFIDENISYGKVAKGLGGKTESIAKKLRSNINKSISDEYGKYGEANARYSDTIGVMDDIQKASGSSVNLFGANTEKALGTTLRRLMSNTQSRVNLMDSIKELKRVGDKYGGAYNDDMLTQVMFADELDSMFNTAGRTSFQGQIKKAVSSKGVTERVIDYAGDVAEKARGINEDAAIKAIKKLLSEQ